MSKIHHQWARFMSVEALKNIQRDTSLGKASGLDVAYSPSLSLIPRPCPHCQIIALYRLIRLDIADHPFVLHLWTCAECIGSAMIATDTDGKELPPKPFSMAGDWL